MPCPRVTRKLRVRIIAEARALGADGAAWLFSRQIMELKKFDVGGAGYPN
jgi:hypothetical protein